MVTKTPGIVSGIARKISRRFVDGLAYTIDLIGEDLHRRKAIRQLRELDQRVLADIGIVTGGVQSFQSWPMEAVRCPLQ